MIKKELKKIFLILVLLLVWQSYSFGQTTDENFNLQIYKGFIQEVRNEKKSFSEKHPDIKTFLSWDSPYAYLCVGECGTQEEALKLQELLLIEYPNSILKKCD